MSKAKTRKGQKKAARKVEKGFEESKAPMLGKRCQRGYRAGLTRQSTVERYK